jgi:glycosyltransferase involved in cell wall biosynthesis
MAERRAWLILAHAFNMDGRAASQTITDKIPHLLALGIEPVVLSAVTGRRDDAIEHHQLLPVSPVGLRFDLRFILRRHIASKLGYKAAVGLMTLVLLPFYIVEKLFIRLEPQWSWFISAYLAGARIIRSRSPEVVYSTGGANSAHLAGYLLAKRYGLPWIAEVHDPMVYENWERRKMAYRFAGWLEGRICERADVAIWFVEQALERARQRHPLLDGRGKVMVPGADAPAFGKLAYRRGRELVIGHFGSLSATRNLETFAQALGELLRRRPDLKGLLRLEIYGAELDAVSERALAALPFPEVVRRLGRLEADPATGESGRDRVLKRMQTVDALLLLHGMHRFCEEYIPSKLYEYLWTQRPILGLTWHNPHLDRILEEGGHWAIPTGDVPGIVAALEELVARWEADRLQDSGKPSPYTTEAAARQLLGWVDEVLKARGGRGGAFAGSQEQRRRESA